MLTLKQGFDPAILMPDGIGPLFALDAAPGEYKIRGPLRLIGAKDNTPQKNGGGEFGDRPKTTRA